MKSRSNVKDFYNYLVGINFFDETEHGIAQSRPQSAGIGIGSVALRKAVSVKSPGKKRNGKQQDVHISDTSGKERVAWETVKPHYNQLADLYDENMYTTVAAFVEDALKVVACAISGDVPGALIILLKHMYNYFKGL